MSSSAFSATRVVDDPPGAFALATTRPGERAGLLTLWDGREAIVRVLAPTVHLTVDIDILLPLCAVRSERANRDTFSRMFLRNAANVRRDRCVLRSIQLQCSNVKDAQSTLATFLDTLTCVLGHIISCHDTGTIGSPVNGLFACTTPSSFRAVVR